MQRVQTYLSNLIFGFAVLALILMLFDKYIQVPAWLISAGRIHPLVLHLPIGMYVLYMVMLPFVRSAKDSVTDGLMDLMLRIACLMSFLSAVTGSMLSHELQAYNSSQLSVHRYAGFAFAFGLYLLCFTDTKRKLLRAFLLCANATLLIITGHKGAEITHGKNFLFPDNKDAINTSSSGQSVYTEWIIPVFKNKCFSCHNPEKKKGGLIMSDTLSLSAGGKSGPLWISGHADSSLIIKNIMLPLSDEAHMPPEGKPQLTALEIDLLKAWINSGVSFNRSADSYQKNDTLRIITDQMSTLKNRTIKSYNFEAADAEELEKINTHFLVVKPVNVGSPALSVSIFLASEYKTDHLKKLLAVKKQIVQLNLIDIPVRDADMQIISEFSALEKLILNGTEITDSGIKKLEELKNLEHLSLSKTKVTNDLENIINKLPRLRNVFVNETAIKKDIIDLWQKKYPQIFFCCASAADEKIKLSPPLLANENTTITSGEDIALKHYIKGVKIKYTTDGSIPDTVNGREYNGPFKISGSADVKAVAVKEGWYASEPITFSLFERGVLPDSTQLLSAPNIQYPGRGHLTFTDGNRGPISNLKDPNWIAFREGPFVAVCRFGGPVSIHKISFCYGLQVQAYVFPPVDIKISGSNDNKNFMLLAANKIPPFLKEDKDQVKPGVVHLQLTGKPFKYYKVEAHNLPVIPKWHPGKGEAGWLFIDEIFFYK